jgi:hypothetical protein
MVNVASIRKYIALRLTPCVRYLMQPLQTCSMYTQKIIRTHSDPLLCIDWIGHQSVSQHQSQRPQRSSGLQRIPDIH